MSTESIEMGFKEYRIRMVARKEADKITMCWKRDDGNIVSPIFTSQEACIYYGNKMPLITDEEWAEHYPLSSQGNLRETSVFIETPEPEKI